MPVLSPARAAIWGAILAAPAALFLGANLLNEAGFPALYNWIDPWIGRTGVWRFIGLGSPLVLLGGIGLALLLNALAITRLSTSSEATVDRGIRQDARRFTCTLTVEPHLPNIALLVTSGLILASLLAYAVVENYALIRTHAGN